jgi:hypothetical protein
MSTGGVVKEILSLFLSSIFSNTQLQTLLPHKFLLEVSFNTPPVDILSAAAKNLRVYVLDLSLCNL